MNNLFGPGVVDGDWRKQGIRNVACPMCQEYAVPGFILNAWEVVPCFQCNPDNVLKLDKPSKEDVCRTY